MDHKSFFSSRRERRLWLWALGVVAAIYASLPFVGAIAAALRERGILVAAFVAGFVLVIAAIVGAALRRRPGRRELWVGLGVVAAYVMVVVRLGIGPEERTHLFEYGLVAALVYHALAERATNGRRVWAPAVTSVLLTAAVGWIDEGIQWMLPNRVYDLRDVGFNALAAFMAVAAIATLRWARRSDLLRRRAR